MQRILEDHALIGSAIEIPVPSPVAILSYSPVVISAPDRHVDLQLKVTAPVSGTNLPIVLLSHGHGSSYHLSSFNGYGAIVNFWASRGFVVVQPTHLSSKTLNLPSTVPGAPFFGTSRAKDMSMIIDNLDMIQKTVPLLAGRLDISQIAVVGHSLGGNTASMLLGAQIILPASDPDAQNGETTVVDLHEPRIKAGILFAAPGSPGIDGCDLTDFAKKWSMFRHISFNNMATPALVVVGDKDASVHLTNRGPGWHSDAFTQGSGSKSLFTIFGGNHLLGGISGFDAFEAKNLDDDNPELASAVMRMTWAYLRSALYPGDTAWSKACAALEKVKSLGKVEEK